MKGKEEEGQTRSWMFLTVREKQIHRKNRLSQLRGLRMIFCKTRETRPVAQMFCDTERNVRVQRPGSHTRPSGALCQEPSCTGRESVL